MKNFTYDALIAWLEREIHCVMNTTPHLYNLRHPKRPSVAHVPVIALRADGGYRHPRLKVRDPFSHAVYIQKLLSNKYPPTNVARAEDTATVLGAFMHRLNS